MVRSTLYVLLPLSLVLALALVSQGVIQNFSPYQDVQTVEALHYDQPRVDAQGQPVLDAKGQPVTDPAVTQTQTLAMGPVASQE
ncbi:potassium-transporting ATPase subunit KdpA, partial [Paraburkholderia sp. SIMBA_009]